KTGRNLSRDIEVQMTDPANRLPLLTNLDVTTVEERSMIIHHQSHSLRPTHNASATSQPRPEIPGSHRKIILDPLQLRYRRVHRTRNDIHRSKIITTTIYRRTGPAQLLLWHSVPVKKYRISCGH